jgi:hypothetical protein
MFDLAPFEEQFGNGTEDALSSMRRSCFGEPTVAYVAVSSPSRLSPVADLRRRQTPLVQVGEENGAAVVWSVMLARIQLVRPVHLHWICHFLSLSMAPPRHSSMYIPVLARAQAPRELAPF